MVLSPDSDFFKYFSSPSLPAKKISPLPLGRGRKSETGDVAVLPRRRFFFGQICKRLKYPAT